LRGFIKLESDTDSEHRARGPLVLVATDAAVYAMACVYAALGTSARKVEVFRDRHEAEEWLDAQRIS
jgi:hypothetical protein